MKPGERIRLITECAESCLLRAWPEAQLTLDQFGFETYEPGRDWTEFDERSYFIGQLKEGRDESLLQLHEYLLGDDAAPGNVADHPWGALPLKVFLSHIHPHRVLVSDVKRSLTFAGAVE